MKHQGVATVTSAIFALLTAFPTIASAEKILRYTDHEPYGNMRTQLIKNVFLSEIEKESQGRLKIEAHWEGDISSSYNALSTLGKGTRADIGIVVPEYTAEQLPLHQIFIVHQSIDGQLNRQFIRILIQASLLINRDLVFFHRQKAVR